MIGRLRNVSDRVGNVEGYYVRRFGQWSVVETIVMKPLVAKAKNEVAKSKPTWNELVEIVCHLSLIHI